MSGLLCIKKGPGPDNRNPLYFQREFTFAEEMAT